MIDIDERELRFDEWRTNARNPVTVRITHTPTMAVGEATEPSRLLARQVAWKRLEVALLVAGDFS